MVVVTYMADSLRGEHVSVAFLCPDLIPNIPYSKTLCVQCTDSVPGATSHTDRNPSSSPDLLQHTKDVLADVMVLFIQQYSYR